MEKKTDPSVVLQGADELHIKDVGVFLLKDKKAYYKNGKPVEEGKLFVCQHCETSPPFVTPKEIDFARHMIDKHPEYANGKTPEAREAEEKAEAAKKAEKAAIERVATEKAAAAKAKAEKTAAAKKAKAEKAKKKAKK